MPLTSLTTCYKTLPSYFADKVTQQMRKRRESYLATDNKGEEKQITNTCYAKSSQFSSSENGKGHDRFMTKRSCNSLVTVSDNESEDGSTARSRSAGEDKVESMSGRVATTVSYIIRQQRSPRTATSLDNVDLWEEEESDADDRNSPGFDRINGVPINPRSTIDFSELRRSRSPVVGKRNRRNEDVDAWTSVKPIQTTNAAELKADMIEAKKSLMDVKNRAKTERTPSKVPKTTLAPLPPRKTGTDQPVTQRHRRRSDGAEEVRSPFEKEKISDCSKLQMPPLSSTYTFTDSNPASVLQTGGGMKQTLTAVKVKELNRVNHKLSAKTSPKQWPAGGQVASPSTRDDLKRVRDLDNGCSTDSDLSSGSGGRSPERKVKFNNFVTVRHGQVNTFKYLRESKNSAQVIKQISLGISNNKTVDRS